MVIVMSLGLIFIPNSLDASFFGLVTAGSVLGLCYSVFAVWVSVSVWRAAKNCVNRCWFIVTRFTMIVYGAGLILPFIVWQLDPIK
jgi:hypothetical protein